MSGVRSSGWHHWKINDYYQISDAWGKAQNLYDWLYNKHKKQHYKIVNTSDVQKYSKILYNTYPNPRCVAAVFFDFGNDGHIDHAALLGTITKWGNKKTFVKGIFCKKLRLKIA